jgi:hypothetical protein
MEVGQKPAIFEPLLLFLVRHYCVRFEEIRED